jgi:hypothetical protein
MTIDYFEKQNMGGQMIKSFAVVLSVVMAIGAVFGAANTMYAAVASRIREIATMRVLGFGSASSMGFGPRGKPPMTSPRSIPGPRRQLASAMWKARVGP